MTKLPRTTTLKVVQCSILCLLWGVVCRRPLCAVYSFRSEVAADIDLCISQLIEVPCDLTHYEISCHMYWKEMFELICLPVVIWFLVSLHCFCFIVSMAICCFPQIRVSTCLPLATAAFFWMRFLWAIFNTELHLYFTVVAMAGVQS
jgi:uncharacterized membrane protein